MVQWVKYSSSTFSSFKSALCTEEIIAVGHCYTPHGCLLDPKYINKIAKWGSYKDISEVQAFLGMIGMCWMFILHFAKHANPLVHLTCKGIPFHFGPEQIAAQEDLKQAFMNSPALRPIDYALDSLVILTVDTLSITVGFYLCQADTTDPWWRFYTRFGSISLNDQE